MTRGEFSELHYIAHIANVVSIYLNGILSHNQAGGVKHKSIADEKVQKRRRGKRVPGGRLLHSYVNLYICARNPMLYRLQAQHKGLCVLSISTSVLDLPNVVVTDRNASRDFARFRPAPEGLSIVDKEIVFAEYWTHQDPKEEYRRSGIKCAEVLVPDRVDPGFILSAYVSCQESASELGSLLTSANIALRVQVNGHLFFL